MNGNKDSNSDICVYMSKSEFSEDEIRSINGAIMKKLFTIEHRMVDSDSIDTNGRRSIVIRQGERKGGKTREKEREEKGRGQEEE
jgi:hypothetical protein